MIPNPGMGKEVFNNFYWEHLDRFADTAACLYRLPGAEVKFDWGEEVEDSFQKLKKAIIEAPLLVFPKKGGGFVLDTDVSDKARKAFLCHLQDRKERVIAYGSSVLSTVQRNYCVTRK